MERAASSPGCPPDLLLLSLSGELRGHWERADPARELHIQLGGQGKEDPGPDPCAAQVGARAPASIATALCLRLPPNHPMPPPDCLPHALCTPSR